jgi:hypothetical protein
LFILTIKASAQHLNDAQKRCLKYCLTNWWGSARFALFCTFLVVFFCQMMTQLGVDVPDVPGGFFVSLPSSCWIRSTFHAFSFGSYTATKFMTHLHVHKHCYSTGLSH